MLTDSSTLRCVCIALFIIPISQALGAAELADSTARVTSNQGALEEIIVTARRRDEDVQKVPETVQVISQQALQEQNVQTLNDLQYLVPELSGHTNTPNAIQLSLRGQGATGNNSWPGVTMFMNDVPFANFAGGASNTGPGLFFDLENIQVLKGPQGTLFGKSSVGGDILLRSARPTNDMGGYLDFGVGNYNDREFDGAVNVPIIEDKLLTRIAFFSQTRDGYTNILGTPTWANGIDGDNRDAHSVRISVTLHPVDWLHNDTVWTNSQSVTRSTFGVLTYVGPSFIAAHPTVVALLGQQQGSGIRTILPTDVDPVANISTNMVTNTTVIDLGDNMSLKNIASYDKDNNTLAGDQDGTVFRWVDVYATPLSTDIVQYTDELQLAGKNFDRRLDWVIGGFYLEQPAYANSLSHYAIGNYAFTDSEYYQITTGGLTSKAGYAHGIYDLSDLVHGLKINGGARYSKDAFSGIGYYGSGYCLGPVAPCAAAAGAPSSSTGYSHALTWTAGLEEQITDGTLLYVTTSKGYNPGGQNAFDSVNNIQPPAFGPEYVIETELGVKSDWMLADVPIRTNADIWHQDYTNIQEQVLHSAQAYTQNAGSATLWGWELEANAYLTRALEVGVNYGHGYITYRHFLPDTDPGAIAQLQATRTTNFPPNKVNAHVRYRLPVAGEVGDLSVRADYNWQASSGWEGVVNNLGIQKAFGLLNLSANWGSAYGKPVDVELFLSNATNQIYTTEAAQGWQPLYYGYANEIYGQPRMYGFRVKYRFGNNAK
jgi:iron complex outermembrane recepter protein